MKKIRKQFKELKEGFLTAKIERQVPAYMLANTIFILFVFHIIYTISAIIYNFFQVVGICMLIISIILVFVFMFWNRAFYKTMPISAKIFDYFFARYGLVVRKNDWKRLKKENKGAYKYIWAKKNIGHCYAVACVLASWIEDAKVMYCSIAYKDGQTAHAVVVKNNCIYDTNIRRHFDFDEYIKMNKAEVYQIFEKEVYCKKSFFDDVRQGFMNWCAERNVYCDPQ